MCRSVQTAHDITLVLGVSQTIDALVPVAVLGGSQHSLPVIMASLTKEMVYYGMLA